MTNSSFIMAFVMTMVMVSCSGNSGSKQNNTAGLPAVDVEKGKSVYLKHCQVCHQANGMGVPNAFPPLKGNDRVGGDKQKVIDILLNGLAGPVEVNGLTYDNIMAPYRNLSDNEIADVLNYIRMGLNGINDGAISANDVATLRKQ
jgi:mono/diheme cytochrome c family protein